MSIYKLIANQKVFLLNDRDLFRPFLMWNLRVRIPEQMLKQKSNLIVYSSWNDGARG